MDRATAIAIAKTIGKGLDLQPGVYPIDTEVTLRVKGTVRRGADVEYTPTVAIPLKTTLALVLKKAGFQRKNAKRILIEAMHDAIILEQSGADKIAELDDLREAEKHVQDIIGTLPSKTRKGATTVKVTITETKGANHAKV